MNDWQDRLVDAGLRQLHGEEPPDQTAVILHRLQTELAAVTVVPPPPAPRRTAPLLLLSSLLGAAAALLLVWLLMAPGPAAAPTVVRIELAALAGGVECLEPATAPQPGPRQVLLAGEHGEWRAQVGSALLSLGDAGVDLSVRPFGVLTTGPDTNLEVRSMEFTLRNGALATGALTFAVVAGVATWHTLTRNEAVVAGQELRIEAQNAGGDKAAELALANQKLAQQNQELQARVQQLQTQLERKVADAPASAPTPEEPPPPVAADSPGGEPMFDDPRFQELLASIDWEVVGSTSAEMGPKLAALLAALNEGKELDMEEAIAIQKLNGKLLDMVPKLMESGLPGCGPNGVFTHPLVAGNSLASMLQTSGQPLSADQKATLQNLVRSYTAENQTVQDMPGDFRLEKLAAESVMKDRFYEQMAANLSPEQRRLMYPEGAGRFDGSSLFSTGLMWTAYGQGIPAGNAAEFARAASQGLERQLGLDEKGAAAVRAVIERVAGQSVAIWQDKGLPIELLPGPGSHLKTGRGAQALAVQLQWMRELQNSGVLTPQQLQQLRTLSRVYVPVPR